MAILRNGIPSARGASQVFWTSLENTAGEVTVAPGPAILTCVVLAELTGVAGANVALCTVPGAILFMFAVPAGGTVVFADTVALPDGLVASCTSGEVSLTVCLR